MPHTDKGSWRYTDKEIEQYLKKVEVASAEEVGKALNICKDHAQKFINILLDAKRVYISERRKIHTFGPARNFYSPVETGEEKHAQPPKKKSRYAAVKEYRQRQKMKKLLEMTSGSITQNGCE